MKQSITIAIVGTALFVTLFLGTGCSNFDKTARALAKDKAILLLNTPYGRLTRIGETTNSIEVSIDGRVIINPPQIAAPAPTPIILQLEGLTNATVDASDDKPIKRVIPAKKK